MRRRVVLDAVVLLALGGAGLVYRSRRGTEQGARSPSAEAGAAASAVPAGRGDLSSGLASSPLVQPGVQPRRVAGRVTFEGSPVDGAVVRLESVPAFYGELLAKVTTKDGCFDLGVSRRTGSR